MISSRIRGFVLSTFCVASTLSLGMGTVSANELGRIAFSPAQITNGASRATAQFSNVEGQLEPKVDGRTVSGTETVSDLGFEYLPSSEKNFELKVTNVYKNSAAELSGIRAGDTVCDIAVDADGTTNLKVRRFGAPFAVVIQSEKPKNLEDLEESGSRHAQQLVSSIAAASVLYGNVGHSEKRKHNSLSNSLSRNILSANASQLQSGTDAKLEPRDLVVLIDHTASMMHEDCPQGLTRWEWTRRQTMALTADLQQRVDGDITVIPFATDYQVYEKCNADSVRNLFRKMEPGGCTHPENALKFVFDSYFARRDANPQARPLMIAVITDGVPSEPDAVKDVIVEGASKLADKNEVVVSFMQIAHDHVGSGIMKEFDDLTIRDGARFDIVDHVDFEKVQAAGIESCLVESWQEHRLAQTKAPKVVAVGMADPNRNALAK